MKHLLAIFVAMAAFAGTCMASLASTAGITWTLSGSNYTYTVTLHNTGTTTIGTFFYAWIPGENFLPKAPSSVVSPAGWSGSVQHGSATDGYGILWTTSAPIAPGTTVTGFQFTTTVDPFKILGKSPFYPTMPIQTSFVYIRQLFGDPGFEFVVTGPQEPFMSSIAMDAAAIVGGNNVGGTVTLTRNAPAAGVVVSLSTSSGAVKVPPTVTVASGTKSVRFNATTLGQDAARTVKITAIANATEKTTTIILNPAAMSGFSISPTTITDAETATGTVTFNGKTGPTATTLSVSNDHPSDVNLPTTEPVKTEGAVTTFKFGTVGTPPAETVTVTVTYKGISLTATVNLSGNQALSLLDAPSLELSWPESTTSFEGHHADKWMDASRRVYASL